VLLVAALVAALVTVPAAGGRLDALADVTIKRAWMLLAAVGLQVLVIYVAPEAPPLSLAAGHVLSYVAAAYFLIANRHIPGWWLIGLGGAMNFIAIASNAGVMPASRSAVAAAGLTEIPGRFTNSAVIVDPNLGWLGDVFAIPAAWPLANVFSAGDVCLALGGAVALHGICRSRLAVTGRGEFTRLFRHPAFVRVWSAQATSNLGDWTYALAVSTALVQRTGSARALAWLLIAQVGPAALAGLCGGMLVDRWPRRTLMVTLDLVRAVAVASLLLGGEPTLVHFYGVAVCLGVCEALFQPSVHASIPNLVPRDRIVAANSLISVTFNVAVMAGPALGGVLVAQFGLGPVLALNAGTFVLSALLLAGVAVPRASATGSSALRDLEAGIRYSLRSPLVRGVFVVIGCVMFAAGVRSPLEPLFVLDSLGLTPQSLGLIGASWGLGMVLGAAAAPAAARRWPRERLLPLGIILVGGAVFGASQAEDLSAVAGLWLVSGVGNALGAVSYESLLQERTPADVRGRVMAAAEAVLNAAFLGGAWVSGWLGSSAGVRPAFAASGALFMLGGASSLVLIKERRARHAAARRTPRMVAAIASAPRLGE
jgi:predicted MFS family arabinose efflux permease